MNVTKPTSLKKSKKGKTQSGGSLSNFGNVQIVLSTLKNLKGIIPYMNVVK